jgi:hypothetical protein
MGHRAVLQALQTDLSPRQAAQPQSRPCGLRTAVVAARPLDHDVPCQSATRRGRPGTWLLERGRHAQSVWAGLAWREVQANAGRRPIERGARRGSAPRQTQSRLPSQEIRTARKTAENPACQPSLTATCQTAYRTSNEKKVNGVGCHPAVST